jgi:ribonuclease E
MLIDARHQEETRVAVLKGNRIEEFDFESADRKQIKGNIYLAKVTRVEPSLQAAFVDFGGNRHGFLAFSEIHPDYYQIPREDREALLAEEAAHAEEEAALRAAEDGDEDEDAEGNLRGDDMDDAGGVTEIDTSEKDQVATIEDGQVENGFDDADDDGESDDARGDDEGDGEGDQRRRGRRRQGKVRSSEADELRAKRMALRRRYKIQDVIHRRQVLLVQVVKEERGNKGAALTSYLSLAGRYCVLMPNSSHGGGISRKISSASDRKRLKGIIAEMDLPRSMGCIVRTAGLQRTKTEIKRDFDYLARLWDEIRELTLRSSAPTLIHSDSDLIKRAIRDIYNRDIEEVVVEGEQGYRAARDFMKLLMPSHARKVRAYSDPVPLFQRYGAEDQLSAMYDPVVQLKSGGYIVINPTEALVSIDINSGRSTKEHGIEATALNTNLEAAREIARQLRLRDMAGLVVIDFIDMEYGSNVRKVEKAMKDALKNDRARIQVGRISGFGLMEMSRQRLRTGVLEATTRTCPHCDGSGLVRTASSAGLSALRLIEDEAAKGKGTVITLYASTEASIYLLNAKRADLAEIEDRYGVRVEVIPEGEDEGAKMRVISSGPRPEFMPRFDPIVEPEDFEEIEEEVAEEEDEEEEAEASEAGSADGEGRRKRRKRRRGRSRDRRDDQPGDEAADEAADDAAAAPAAESEGDEDDDGEDGETGEAGDVETGDSESPRKRRRRGRRRRGGRGRGDGSEGEAGSDGGETADGEAEAEIEVEVLADVAAAEPEVAHEVASADAAAEPADAPEAEAEAPAPKKRSRRKKADAPVSEDSPVAEAAPAGDAPAEDVTAEDVTAEDVTAGDVAAGEAPARPKRSRRKKADEPASEAAAGETAEAPAEKPKRTRRKKAEAVETAETVEAQPVEAPEAQAEVVTGPVAAAEQAPARQTDAETAPEPALAVAAEAPAATGGDADADGDDGEPDGEPRRGWWQRTFGN